jgi:large subunit ribosomal protein L17
VRHKVYGRHLGRNTDQRKALFKNLVSSLILSEKIETTEQKAKAIKPLFDKLVTSASSKKNSNSQRLVSQFLGSNQASEKLIKEIVPRLGNRTSGFTSVTRLGRRLGDGATVVQMRLLLEENSKKESRVKSLESSKTEKQSQEKPTARGANLLAKVGVGRTKEEKKAETKKSAKKEAK